MHGGAVAPSGSQWTLCFKSHVFTSSSIEQYARDVTQVGAHLNRPWSVLCREVVTLLDLAYHYGAPEDSRAADALQRRLLHDDSKDAGVLNRIVAAMKDFKRHDKKIAKQARRETRAYGADLTKTLHVVLRVYGRLAAEEFSVKKRTRYHTARRGGAGAGSKKGATGAGKDGTAQDEDDDGVEWDAYEEQRAAEEAAEAADAIADGGAAVRDGAGDRAPVAADAVAAGDAPAGAPVAAAAAGSEEGDKGGEDRYVGVDVERQLDWQQLLKTIGHADVLKLYMFLLEQYTALDAAALHAITAYLRRVTDELQLGPLLWQVRLCWLCCYTLCASYFANACDRPAVLLIAWRLTSGCMKFDVDGLPALWVLTFVNEVLCLHCKSAVLRLTRRLHPSCHAYNT